MVDLVEVAPVEARNGPERVKCDRMAETEWRKLYHRRFLFRNESASEVLDECAEHGGIAMLRRTEEEIEDSAGGDNASLTTASEHLKLFSLKICS